MKHLKDKSASNLKAGDFLAGHTYFAESIHCYYYSCFQLMLYMKENEPDLKEYYKNHYNESFAEFSHQNLFTTFFVHLSAGNSAAIAAANFNKAIQKLRYLRVRADYHNVQIKKEESFLAQKEANTVLNILRENYTIEEYE